jgi:hypothetical protein
MEISICSDYSGVMIGPGEYIYTDLDFKEAVVGMDWKE